MATAFHAELVTPERVLFSGEVDEISMRTDAGEIAFLAHHEDYMAAVDITVARLHVVGAGSGAEGEGHELRVAVHGGFVHVEETGVTILAGVAELAGEIDVERARRALAAAEVEVQQAPAGAQGQTSAPAGTDAHDGTAGAGPAVPQSGAMLAILAPGSPEAALRRARARLEAAGAA